MSRHEQSLFENLIDTCSRLPWWQGVLLAVAAYFGLHELAGSAWVSQESLDLLVFYGQFALPAGLLLVAAMSAYGRHARGASLDRVTASPRRNPLTNMSGQQFEMLVAEAFRRKGYSVIRKGGSAECGADLALKKSDQTFLVQLRQWRSIKVGVNAVRELDEAMAERGAAGGFVVTSGVFTDEAMALAKGRHIKLMDGKALKSLIRGVSVPAKVFRDPFSMLTRGAPFCPECQGRMAKKKATKGHNAGKAFWRCLRYPDCKGKRPA